MPRVINYQAGINAQSKVDPWNRDRKFYRWLRDLAESNGFGLERWLVWIKSDAECAGPYRSHSDLRIRLLGTRPEHDPSLYATMIQRGQILKISVRA